MPKIKRSKLIVIIVFTAITSLLVSLFPTSNRSFHGISRFVGRWYKMKINIFGTKNNIISTALYYIYQKKVVLQCVGV